MSRPRLSEHLQLEIAHALHVGHRPGEPPPLAPGGPVPGCGCPECTAIPEDAPARQPLRPRAAHDPLPLDLARGVPTLEVAHRLGLELRRVGRSWRGPCPVHRGEHPNFSVMEDGGARCWSCGWRGDGIELWMTIRGVPFPVAVRELAA